MLENLERQKAAHIKLYGTPMTPAQHAHAVATMLALQSMYFEDPSSASRPELHRAPFYEALAPQSSVDPVVLSDSLARAAAARCSASDHSSSAAFAAISEVGYSIGCPPTADVALICDELCDIQRRLAAAGLPPQFVFVFNAAWQLLDHLWRVAAQGVLGEGCVMEADMNCWALRRECAGAGGSERYIGGNFGASHRDQRYSACHSDADGAPQSVNVWCAFNASGARACNGAMRVIPIGADDFFYCPSHPLHSNTAAALACDDGRALSAAVVLESERGQACVWTPSLIHWGGACSHSSVEEPRASIAVTFRSKDAPASAFGALSSTTSTAPSDGPPPLLLHQLSALPLQRRLAYVAKAVLAYSHWHPGFPGVELAD